LWGRDTQQDEPQAAKLWTGDGGIAVAQNLASENEVDAMMARAEATGTRILKPAAKTFWGGSDGYFRRSRRTCMGSCHQSVLETRG
jgi:uncharacterized glyoxalase superfamily protein PhnB